MESERKLANLEGYIKGIEDLLKLDSNRAAVTYSGNQEDHFLRLQSLIRCAIQHCGVAFTSAKERQILSALTLARTALEHALMAGYLYQTPQGHELSEIVMDKHRLDLGKMAILGGSIEGGNRLLASVKFKQKDYNRVPTNPTKLIKKFKERDALSHLYFILSQSSHPISAFFQYVDLEDDGQSRRIRRHALDQDPMSVIPFIFQILSIALLADASICEDGALRDAVFKIGHESFADPDLSLTIQ